MSMPRLFQLFLLLFTPSILFCQGIPVLDTIGGWMQSPPTAVLMAPSSLKVQVLFIGERDSVLTTKGMARSKGRNDYVTFVPITPGVADSGYVCINHESIVADSMIGDGGGMTVIKVVRDGDSLRKVGPARSVDFSHVGGTLSNCAGITSPSGRVWTGEEAWRSNNASLFSADTANVTLAPLGQVPGPGEIFNDIPGDYSGRSFEKFRNYNYMVEVDPATARAVRKQYNWGRMQMEGGVVLGDNRTVIMTPDAAPCFIPRFVADVAEDFTQGHTFAYQQQADGSGGWAEINNNSIDSMWRFSNLAAREGCTMFLRLEWGTVHNGKVYMSETGRDDPQSAFRGWHLAGAHVAKHHLDRARLQNPLLLNMPDSQVEDSICFGSWQYHDYFGRILEYDPLTDKVSVYLEGGPIWKVNTTYPENHLSSPDAISILHVNGRDFMLVAEDLTGSTQGRIPPGSNTPYCEIYMLDMSIPSPTVEDLQRLAVVPRGAEATGTATTPDGKTVFFCSQHPYGSNPFPYNFSVTLALSGWDSIITSFGEEQPSNPVKAWPNPVSRILHFDRVVSGRVYNTAGQLQMEVEQERRIDCKDLAEGIYFLWMDNAKSVRFMVAR